MTISNAMDCTTVVGSVLFFLNHNLVILSTPCVGRFACRSFYVLSEHFVMVIKCGCWLDPVLHVLRFFLLNMCTVNLLVHKVYY